MSLWRVKHTLSPIVEASLLGVVAAYGLFVIWYASLAPMAVPVTLSISSVPQTVTLDTDAWSRHDANDFAFAIPPDWRLDMSDATRIRVGRSVPELATAGAASGGVLIATVPLGDRQEIANLAAEDFSDARAASYDVGVDGRSAIFKTAFQNGRVIRQAVYVPMGRTALVIRSASVDPSVFATLVSTIKFYKP